MNELKVVGLGSLGTPQCHHRSERHSFPMLNVNVSQYKADNRID